MKWLLIVMIFDEEENIMETIEYRFDSYHSCMEFRSLLYESFDEDDEIYDYKIVAMNTSL